MEHTPPTSTSRSRPALPSAWSLALRCSRWVTDVPHGALAGALAGVFVLQALFLVAPSTAATVAGHDGGAGVPSLAEGSTAACVEDEQTLCLAKGRFEVQVDWTDFDGNDGSGLTVPLPSDSSGLFYFFDSSNIEMLVKVLDGCILNDRFWVFFAATTNVRFTLSVRDTETGMVKGYENPLGNAADAVTDTSAFATCDGANASNAFSRSTLDLLPLRRRGAGRSPVPRPTQGALPTVGPLATARPVTLTAAAADESVRDAASTCVADEFSHCLNQGRFRIEVDWRDFQGNTGVGRSADIPGSSDSGLFTFFDPDNLEMLIKVLDGCTLNDRFWVFFAATTNVGFEVRVTDTLTNTVKTYANELGQPANAITDTSAFATCDGTPQPPDLVLDAEEQNRASADLPIEGGSVTATADDGTVYSLTFPPGALNQPETISLTPAAAATDSLGEVLAAVLLEPSGLQFLEPARLEIELTPEADLDPGELVGFRANGDGTGFFLTGVGTDGLSATLDVPHFSAAGVGRVDDPFSAFCPFELLEASLPASSLARLRLEILTMALIAGCVDDDPLVAGQIVADIFEEWYLEAVLPATQQAAQDPEASIRHALGRANEWLRTLNTDPLAQELGAADRLRLPFPCPGGSCVFLEEAAVQTAESLLESLRLAVAQADSRCLSEGLNDDLATLEWIDLGNVLVTQGNPQFQDAESVWRSAPEPLEIKTCGLQKLRWQVGESSESENPRAFLLLEVPEDIEITGHDGSGREITLDPGGNPFHRPTFLAIGDIEVDPSVNAKPQVTPLEGGDLGLSATTFFPRSGDMILRSDLQVHSIDLNGRWLIESLSTENNCEPPAPVPPDELATVGQETTVLTVRLDDSFDKPLSGPLVHDSLDQPFRFELGPESSTTAAFCQLFNTDTCEAIGVCEPGDDAVPLFCRERRLVRGAIDDDSGDRVTAKARFLDELTYDFLPGGSVEDAVLVTESCEGINQIVATRQ